MNYHHLRDELIAALGAPYYEGTNCLLFCGDTLAMQKRMPPLCFQTIITSPPYNIGKEYEEKKPMEEYVNWTVEWVTDAQRLLSPDGALLLNLGYTAIENRGRAVPHHLNGLSMGTEVMPNPAVGNQNLVIILQ